MEKFVKDFLQDRMNERLTILDIGSQDICGTYRNIFSSPNWKYIGVDAEKGKNVDIVLSNPYQWKEIPSNFADVVVSGQTFEHIEYPWLTMFEIRRIMKPDGLCCIIAPAGGHEHKYPIDCWRIFPDGFRAIARISNIEVIETNAEWKGGPYTDGSEVWQDCVLIGKKTACGDLREFRTRLLHKLIRICMAVLI